MAMTMTCTTNSDNNAEVGIAFGMLRWGWSGGGGGGGGCRVPWVPQIFNVSYALVSPINSQMTLFFFFSVLAPALP